MAASKQSLHKPQKSLSGGHSHVLRREGEGFLLVALLVGFPEACARTLEEVGHWTRDAPPGLIRQAFAKRRGSVVVAHALHSKVLPFSPCRLQGVLGKNSCMKLWGVYALLSG